MATKFRKSPPVCLGISLVRLLLRRLRYSKQYLGNTVKMEDGREFTIFRHITAYPLIESEAATVFIVSFKFARLSHKANKIVSLIPMLLITGFPGFDTKMYVVNNETGYWQGMYQWKSKQALEEYKKSFVFKMMNKRAIKRTVRYIEFNNQQLIDYIDYK
ncbi:MAG: hypothetical protein IMY71_09385 [Bacteroidetes bacterium]|nr:hypothetical protein [Bacteroidota bacterium]